MRADLDTQIARLDPQHRIAELEQQVATLRRQRNEAIDLLAAHEAVPRLVLTPDGWERR